MILIKSYHKSIIWAIVIMVILFTPGSKLPHPGILNFEYSDKLVHAVLFIVLGYIMLFETWAIHFKIQFNQIMVLALIAIIFGGLTELIQQFVAYEREGSIFDFMADFTGIVLAYSIFFAFRKTIGRFYHPTF